jgi:glycosyltransferase involved in cell wall biosynthesis
VSIPLHVAHAVLSLDVGGLERIVIDLIRAGIGEGDRVSVIGLEKDGSLAQTAKQLGAQIHCLHKAPGRRPEIVPHVASLLAGLRPDVLHTHQIGPAWYLSQVAPSFKIPLLHTEHGNPFARAHSSVAVMKQRLLYAQTSRRLGLFCCVSQDIAKAMARFRTVPRRLLDVIPNGISTDEPRGLASAPEIRAQWDIPSDAMVIGTVGRLDEVKRQDLLIDAFSQLEPGANRYLLLVGDGPERGRLEHRVMDLGLQDRIRFTGFQSQPEAYYRAMDVFVLTSRSEGLPLSLLEAWAAGKPAVCTAVGGIVGVVSDGIDAMLVPSGDAKKVAMALNQLLKDPSRGHRMGQAGHKKVLETYSLERMASAYRIRYEKLSMGKRPGGL